MSDSDIIQTGLYSDIVSELRTKAQTDQFNGAIDAIQSLLFQVDMSIEVVLEKLGQGRLKEAVRRGLLAADPTLSNREMVSVFLGKLKEAISHVKILDLTLAFEPKEKTIDTLFSWVATNLGEGIVLRVKIDKDILGGAIVVWNGLYKDLSLKTQLEKVFEAQKPQILSLVK